MALSPGTKLGRYEILAAAGSGGMGEVYRARDTRLDRIVAVKVLLEAVLRDPGRRQRLEREARAVSSLSHPNICTLHDVGHQDGVDYLVMELLEGETLADRLAKGPLPPDLALRHAVEIAGALDAAHRQGIVHRDLKPGNIMLTRTGAKLLDFGLARADQESAPGISGLSATPTHTRPLTEEGTFVGTVPYMAPEQLEGKPADARSDLFAFGAVLYEMTTGRRAFQGKSQASLIAAILASEPPPLATLQPLAPPSLERVVRRCLAKDPEERWQSARDLMLELKWIAEAAPQAAAARAGSAIPRYRERTWMALALALAAATLVLAVGRFRGATTAGDAIRSSILPPEDSAFYFGGIYSGPVTISPDGRLLAFVGRTPTGRELLWVRPLDSLSFRPLDGTEGASFPFWSPDGRSIGFFADSKLRKIEAQGGPPQTLCETSIARGGSWNEEGTIIFAPDVSDSIYRVPASGGEAVPVTQLDETRHQVNHRWPWFLPDGRHFLFYARSGSDESTGTYVGSLDSKEQKFIVAGRSNAVYAPPGYLLFVREGTLMALPFDARRLEITGGAIAVADPVSVNASVQKAIFSVSSSGILAYQGGVLTGDSQLRWFDRSGKPAGVIGEHGEPTVYLFPRLSPDGRRLVVQIADPRSANSDLWIDDVARGVMTRFTFEPSVETSPVWSPDGTRIAYASNRKGRFHMFAKASSGVGAEEALVEESDADARPLSWSPDGRYIAFTRRQVKGPTRGDIWILPLFGDRKPFPFLHSEFEEAFASFSPDGRFIAYVSNESVRNEVYVTPFPGAGGKWQVSTAGGTSPRWRRDGRELFYMTQDNRIMSVEIGAKGDRLEIGAVRPLFQTRSLQGPGGTYDPSADGKRFLIVSESEQVTSEPITLVVNWTAALPR
jgi:Tol biopolymer transport system component